MLTRKVWTYWKHGRPGLSGYAEFKRERKVERALWPWRRKSKWALGWVWGERQGYRLGLETPASIVRAVKAGKKGKRK